jgi:hypothetical protein
VQRVEPGRARLAALAAGEVRGGDPAEPRAVQGAVELPADQ